MNITKPICVVLILFFTSGCATLTGDIEIEARSDPMAELSAFRTYAWIEPQETVYDPEGRWDARRVNVNDEVKKLISQELQSLRMTEIVDDKLEPDIYVTFTFRADLSNWELQKQPYFSRDKKVYSPRGEFSIVLVDGITGYIAWVGKATANISVQPNEEVLMRRIDYTVYKLFELYPVINQK